MYLSFGNGMPSGHLSWSSGISRHSVNVIFVRSSKRSASTLQIHFLCFIIYSPSIFLPLKLIKPCCLKTIFLSQFLVICNEVSRQRTTYGHSPRSPSTLQEAFARPICWQMWLLVSQRYFWPGVVSGGGYHDRRGRSGQVLPPKGSNAEKCL